MPFASMAAIKQRERFSDSYQKFESNYSQSLEVKDPQSLADICKEESKAHKEVGELLLTYNLAESCLRSKDFEKTIKHYETSIELARKLNCDLAIAKISYNLAKVHEKCSNLYSALDNYYRHLMLVRDLQNINEECKAFYRLTLIFLQVGENDEALRCAKRHYYLCDKIGDVSGKAIAILRYGEAKKRLGRMSESEDRFYSAGLLLDFDNITNEYSEDDNDEKKNDVNLDDPRRKSWEDDNKAAWNLYHKKEHSAAIQEHKINFQVAKNTIGDKLMQMQSLQGLSLCYLATEQENEALRSFQKCFHLALEMGKHISTANSLFYLRKICKKKIEQFKELEDDLKSKSSTEENVNHIIERNTSHKEDSPLRVDSLLEIAQQYEESKKIDEARFTYIMILEKAKAFCDIDMQIQIHIILGEDYFTSGEYSSAIKHYNEIQKLSYADTLKSERITNYYQLFLAYSRLGELPSAWENLHYYLVIKVMEDDYKHQQQSYYDLMNLNAAMGRISDALDCAQAYFVLSKYLQDESGKIVAGESISKFSEMEVKNEDLADEYDMQCNFKPIFKYSIVITSNAYKTTEAKENNDWVTLQKLLREIGDGYALFGKMQLAEELIRDSLEVADTHKLEQKGEILYELGNILQLRKKFQDALQIFEEYLDFAMENKQLLDEVRACYCLRTLYDRVADKDKAAKYESLHREKTLELGNSLGKNFARKK